MYNIGDKCIYRTKRDKAKSVIITGIRGNTYTVAEARTGKEWTNMYIHHSRLTPVQAESKPVKKPASKPTSKPASKAASKAGFRAGDEALHNNSKRTIKNIVAGAALLDNGAMVAVTDLKPVPAPVIDALEADATRTGDGRVYMSATAFNRLISEVRNHTQQSQELRASIERMIGKDHPEIDRMGPGSRVIYKGRAAVYMDYSDSTNKVKIQDSADDRVKWVNFSNIACA